jgi:hypothetical protein
MHHEKKMWQLQGLSRARAPHISLNGTSVLTSEFGWVQVNTDAYGRHRVVRVFHLVLKITFEQRNSANYLQLPYIKSYYNSNIDTPVNEIARNSTN